MDEMLNNYTFYRTSFNDDLATNATDLLNSTMLSVPDTTITVNSLASNYNYIVWTIVDGFLMFLIICGNTLTVLAVTLSRRLSCLVSNQFVLNLAISDIMVGLTLPFHLTFHVNEHLGAMKWTCILRFILITLSCMASIFNLIAIAVDRYIAIVHPLHYTRYMTKTVTKCLLGGTWTVAIGISLIPVFWNNWDAGQKCEMNLVIPSKYTTVVLLPMFSTVWVVMLVLYWRIWREASCHAKRMRTNTCCSAAAGVNDWKSIQVVLLVMGSFSICWMPYIVVACTQALSIFSPNDQSVYRGTFSLAVANSGINPIIYAWKNAGFRRAFIRLLNCRRPDSADYSHSFRTTSPAQNDKKMHQDAGKTSHGGQRAFAITTFVDGSEKEKGAIAILKADSKKRINNNSFKRDAKITAECGVIEHAKYDETVISDTPKCHIIENAGYEDSLDGDSPAVLTNRAYSKESDEDSVSTLPMSQAMDELHQERIGNK